MRHAPGKTKPGTGVCRHRHRSAAVLSRSSPDYAGLPQCPESHSLTHVLRLRTAALVCPAGAEPLGVEGPRRGDDDNRSGSQESTRKGTPKGRKRTFDRRNTNWQ